MTYKIIFITLLALLFSGCSQKINEHARLLDPLHEQALTQTQKTVIKDGLVSKVFVVATYINQVEHELAGKNDVVDKFIVSMYVPSDQNQTLYDELSFVIDGKIQLFTKELNKDNPLIKLLPSPSPWSKYYLIEAPKKYRSKTITLSFKTHNNASPTITFQKDYL